MADIIEEIQKLKDMAAEYDTLKTMTATSESIYQSMVNGDLPMLKGRHIQKLDSNQVVISRSYFNDLQKHARKPHKVERLEEEIEVLKDKLKALQAVIDSDGSSQELGLTPTEAKFWEAIPLGPRYLSKDNAFEIMYSDRVEPPSLKTLDVLVCHMRPKLEAAFSEYEIETIWGRGWRKVPRGSLPIQGRVRDRRNPK